MSAAAWWWRRAVGAAFDTLHGVDTSAIVPGGVLGITSPNRDAGVAYDPSPWRVVPRTLRLAGLSSPTGFTFVDIGCGKGKVLLSAMTFSFAKIIGIEYSSHLCAIAEQNIDSARFLRRRCSHVEIVCTDAADWIAPAREPTVFYFYNPFQLRVMKAVLRNILDSYKQYRRPIYTIFYRSSSSLEGINNTLLESSHGSAVKLASGRFGQGSVNVYWLPGPGDDGKSA